jgi:hypothetical protein
MKSHISKVRIAALAVGLAIVMSSCGIQNQAGDSSSASGKTKNYALNNAGACFDNVASWRATWTSRYAYWESVGFGEGYNVEFEQLMPPNFRTGPDWDTFFRDLNNGELCPSGGIESLGSSTQGSSTQACVKPEIKQAMIDGYASQVNRPLGGEVTEEYIAKMQKGLNITNAMCTN